jgi:hypothetical protein
VCAHRTVRAQFARLGVQFAHLGCACTPHCAHRSALHFREVRTVRTPEKCIVGVRCRCAPLKKWAGSTPPVREISSVKGFEGRFYACPARQGVVLRRFLLCAGRDDTATPSKKADLHTPGVHFCTLEVCAVHCTPHTAPPLCAETARLVCGVLARCRCALLGTAGVPILHLRCACWCISHPCAHRTLGKASPRPPQGLSKASPRPLQGLPKGPPRPRQVTSKGSPRDLQPLPSIHVHKTPNIC